jgi:hypothetical protein
VSIRSVSSCGLTGSDSLACKGTRP